MEGCLHRGPVLWVKGCVFMRNECRRGRRDEAGFVLVGLKGPGVQTSRGNWTVLRYCKGCCLYIWADNCITCVCMNMHTAKIHFFIVLLKPCKSIWTKIIEDCDRSFLWQRVPRLVCDQLKTCYLTLTKMVIKLEPYNLEDPYLIFKIHINTHLAHNLYVAFNTLCLWFN